jgi:glycosyltransferase involved in cell wall biosynthesis
MRVLLVSNYEPDAQHSMLRYADFLRRGLGEYGHSMEVIHPSALVGRLVSRSSPLFKWLGYIDKFLLFPLWLRTKAAKFDLVHICDHSNSCYLRWTGGTPSLITVHDMLAIRSALGDFPQNPTGPTGQRLQRWILKGLGGAKHLVCVSRKTKQDLEAFIRSKPEITVIHHSLNWEYGPVSQMEISQVRRASGLEPDDEYLLHVGGNQWYKNRLGALKIAFELRKHARFRRVKIVMAGKPWTEGMRSFCRENSFDDAIEFVNPSNEQIRALYSGALAFLFPSLEEGFGWPILEAQACGCLLITSNRPPMTEVAGSGAIFIAPEDAVGAARTIAERFDEAEAIKQAALKNLNGFATDLVMQNYNDAYTSVVVDVRAAR